MLGFETGKSIFQCVCFLCFCINVYFFLCVFVLCFYLPSFWCRGNTRMSCCFVASCHSDKNLSNRLDYLSRLPFASLFIDNSWLITETVSNLQENQSSSWRRPRGCCHHAHLCSNAAHAYMLKCSNAQMLMLKCPTLFKCCSCCSFVLTLMLKYSRCSCCKCYSC